MIFPMQRREVIAVVASTAALALLAEQPLMQNVLADLALESEAALALTLRMGHALDRADDEQEQKFARLVTAIGKYWICKRAPAMINEAARRAPEMPFAATRRYMNGLLGQHSSRASQNVKPRTGRSSTPSWTASSWALWPVWWMGSRGSSPCSSAAMVTTSCCTVPRVPACCGIRRPALRWPSP